MSAGRGTISGLGTAPRDLAFMGSESTGRRRAEINLEEPRGAYR